MHIHINFAKYTQTKCFYVFCDYFFKRDFGQEAKTSEHLLLMQYRSRWSETAHGLNASFEVKYDTK